MAKDSEDEADMDPVERKYKFLTDGGDQAKADESDSDDDDVSEDDRVKRVDDMADELENALRQ